MSSHSCVYRSSSTWRSYSVSLRAHARRAVIAPGNETRQPMGSDRRTRMSILVAVRIVATMYSPLFDRVRRWRSTGEIVATTSPASTRASCFDRRAAPRCLLQVEELRRMSAGTPARSRRDLSPRSDAITRNAPCDLASTLGGARQRSEHLASSRSGRSI